MTVNRRGPTSPQKSPFERVGLWVILLCGGLAFLALAWAASLPDGIVD